MKLLSIAIHIYVSWETPLLLEALRVVMNLQVPREALEFAGMSINFRSGKFGYSICPIFSKGHAEIFREF